MLPSFQCPHAPNVSRSKSNCPNHLGLCSVQLELRVFGQSLRVDWTSAQPPQGPSTACPLALPSLFHWAFSSDLPLPFLGLPLPFLGPSAAFHWPFHGISLPFRCHSLPFHRPSLTFHCIPLAFHCLPLAFHCLSSTFHCVLTDLSPPFTACACGSARTVCRR